MLTLGRTVNPLVYPGYRQPGFDPTHPAAQQCLLSAVAIGNDFFNLIPGQFVSKVAGTIVGTLTSAIDGRIGPVLSGYVGATNYVSFTSAAQTSSLPQTAAAIIYSPGGTNAGIFSAYSAHGFVLSGFSGNLFFTHDGVDVNSGIALTAGWYFVAASYNINLPVTHAINFVVANLATGQIQTATVSTTQSLTGGVTAYNIGYETEFGTAWPGKIAAVMHNTAVVSPAQLLQWAQDPWSFWYPPAVEELIFDSFAVAAAPVAVPLMGQIWM